MDIERLNQILNHYMNKNKLGLRLLLLYRSAHTPLPPSPKGILSLIGFSITNMCGFYSRSVALY